MKNGNFFGEGVSERIRKPSRFFLELGEFQSKQTHSTFKDGEVIGTKMNLSSLMESTPATENQVAGYFSSKETLRKETLEKVYYLPVGLSAVQRDLYEILIKLHKNSIIRQLREGEDDFAAAYTNGNSTEQDDSLPPLSDDDLQNLLYRNMTLISNHPYLLVEHYMPKQLLLMESHERLFLASDKFSKFDKLLGVLEELSLNVVIVGHSIKELDLIEAFILGRDLNYKRYSGTSLYEDQNTVKLEENSAKSSAGSDKKTSKDDDYIPRSQRNRKHPKPAFPLSLHLITHQQLKTTFFEGVALDFIISFDPSLDENDSHINFLRSTTNTKYSADSLVPLIKIIVSQSQYHGFIKLKDSTDDEDALKRNTLFSAIANRRLDHTKELDELCGVSYQNLKGFFRDPFTNRWPVKDLPDFKIHTKEQVVQAVEQDYSIVFRENTTNKRIKTDIIVVPQQLNFKEYHRLLAQLTVARIANIEKTITLNKEKIRPLRLKSTIRHNETDNIKMKIGDLFKESKNLQEEVTVAEKRYERLELEYEKYEQNEKSLVEKKTYLLKIKQGETVLKDEELDSELKELEEFLTNLNSENEELLEKSGVLRSEYQRITSEAAEKSITSKTLDSKNKELLTRLNGQGSKLRQLKNEDIKISNDEEVEKLRANLKFLEFYNKKLSETVKEKISTLTVGRNGRVYRSTTPYI